MAFNKQAAKKAGYSDEEIEQYLLSKKQPVASREPQWSDLPGNILPSAGKNIQAMVEPFVNPVETGKNLMGVATGAVSKLIPGDTKNPNAKQGEDLFNGLINAYKERYGGASNIKKTMIEDPTGFLLDAASLLSGGGAALKGVGAMGKMGKVAKVGSAMQKVSEFVDPISVAGKVTKPVGEFMNDVPGKVVSNYIPRPNASEQLGEASDILFKGGKSLGEDVASRSKIPTTPEKLTKMARVKSTEAWGEIEKALEPHLERDVNIMDIVNPKNVEGNRLTIEGLYDMIDNSAIPNKQPILDDINQVLDDISKKTDLQGNVKLKEVKKIVKNTDASLDKFFNSNNKITEVSPQEQVSIVVSNELRNIINDMVPDLRGLNEEYGIWKDMERAALKVTSKGTKWKPDAIDFGGGIGAYGLTGGNPFAALGPYITRRLLSSTGTGLKAARLLQELIQGTQAISGPVGATGRANYLLNREPQNATPGANLVQ